MKDSLQTALPAHENASYPLRQKFNPKQIIESLPADATPAQQDSAIQAMLPPRPTVRSTRPDTLNLPGWQIPSAKSTLSVQGIRYDENFFSTSPYYHAETNIRPTGMDADPLPYLLRHDPALLFPSSHDHLRQQQKVYQTTLTGLFPQPHGQGETFLDRDGPRNAPRRFPLYAKRIARQPFFLRLHTNYLGPLHVPRFLPYPIGNLCFDLLDLLRIQATVLHICQLDLF